MIQLLHTHPWNLSTADAKAIQHSLRPLVETRDQLPEIRRVAGIDVGFEQRGAITRAAVAVLSFPGLAPMEHALSRLPTSFPYVPGLLSFREIPAVLEAIQQLETLPDLLLCDGQGIAHPRRFGLASHLGVLTGLPTIGVAKSRLIGRHAELATAKGSRVPLMDKEEQIGYVVRSRHGVNPLYVSPGHKISLETAVTYTLACVTRYRLPETTRRAHKLASG